MQEKIKIIYLGSAPVSVRVFDLLYKNPQVEICAVWTKPDQPAGRGKRIMENPVKIKALASGIPEKNIFTLNPSDPESIKLLAGVNCNLGLIAAFGKILPENFFSIPSCGMYNIHFSLLPAYRGASPVQSALLDGISETGVTLQKITAGLDEGEIILQKKF
ncbi:MAG TPA: methionyl-tRNA formyltransferase, partial [Spirochaetia bacterium]|nr:methionyl-tRNA formyltransferase [Spirochaetia bacterium]